MLKPLKKGVKPTKTDIQAREEDMQANLNRDLKQFKRMRKAMQEAKRGK